jgi:hypothetical protein
MWGGGLGDFGSEPGFCDHSLVEGGRGEKPGLDSLWEVCLWAEHPGHAVLPTRLQPSQPPASWARLVVSAEWMAWPHWPPPRLSLGHTAR